jgi:hypothetical protein
MGRRRAGNAKPRRHLLHSPQNGAICHKFALSVGDGRGNAFCGRFQLNSQPSGASFIE